MYNHATSISKGFPQSNKWVEQFVLIVQNTLEDCLKKSGSNKKLKIFIEKIKFSEKKIWIKSLYNPVIVNWCLIQKEKKIISQSDIELLFDNLNHNSYPIPINKSNVNILPVPPQLIVQNMRTFGIGSKGSDSSKASYIKDVNSFFYHKTNILKSVDIIKKYTPGFYNDFKTFVTSIVLLDEHSSFRGASGLSNISLVFFSPDNDWAEFTWAEEIVHETTHNILEVLNVNQSLLLGENVFQEKYKAPFRKDNRHLFGNFHALCVVSRLIQFHTILIKSGVNIKNSKDKIEEYREKSAIPYKTLLADACFSELGKATHDLIISDTLT